MEVSASQEIRLLDSGSEDGRATGREETRSSGALSSTENAAPGASVAELPEAQVPKKRTRKNLCGSEIRRRRNARKAAISGAGPGGPPPGVLVSIGPSVGSSSSGSQNRTRVQTDPNQIRNPAVQRPDEGVARVGSEARVILTRDRPRNRVESGLNRTSGPLLGSVMAQEGTGSRTDSPKRSRVAGDTPPLTRPINKRPKELATTPASSAAEVVKEASLTLGLVRVDEGTFTEGEVAQIKSGILKLMVTEMTEGKKPPIFEGIRLVENTLYTHCGDSFTATWLRSMEGKLGELWSGPALKVVEVSPLGSRPKLHRITLWIPRTNGDNKIVMDMIHWQNPELMANKWMVFNRHLAEHGLRLVCGVPEACLEVLRSRKGVKIHCGVEQASFELHKIPKKTPQHEPSTSSTPMEVVETLSSGALEDTSGSDQAPLEEVFSTLELAQPGGTNQGPDLTLGEVSQPPIGVLTQPLGTLEGAQPTLEAASTGTGSSGTHPVGQRQPRGAELLKERTRRLASSKTLQPVVTATVEDAEDSE